MLLSLLLGKSSYGAMEGTSAHVCFHLFVVSVPTLSLVSCSSFVVVGKIAQFPSHCARTNENKRVRKCLTNYSRGREEQDEIISSLVEALLVNPG